MGVYPKVTNFAARYKSIAKAAKAALRYHCYTTDMTTTMKLLRWILSCLMICTGLTLAAQADDDVLFTVAGEPVTVSEFDYFYSKTYGDQADYSRQSLEEYLDLFVDYKLKVAQARDMGIDTMPTLVKELGGYRQQISNTYLIDREVKEKLLTEAYERKQYDVNISHILIPLQGSDTTSAYQAALGIYKRLQGGEDFATVARQVSEDPYTKEKGGKVGYLTAMMPNGFYAFETAMYDTPVGEVSMPVRSPRGYHLIKVDERRPARGTIEAAHIFVRKQEGKEGTAKARIDEAYAALQGGAGWESTVKKYSEDKTTSGKGGQLGFFLPYTHRGWACSAA